MHSTIPQWKIVHPKHTITSFNSHTAVAYNGVIHLHGGLGKNPNVMLDIDPKTGEAVCQTAKPTRRYSHTSTLFGCHQYIFGGKDFAVRINELWDYNLCDGTCTQIRGSGTPPQPRSSHSAVAWKENLVIFGGHSQEKVLFNDLHLFNLYERKWTNAKYGNCTNDPNIPPPMYMHAAALVDDDMFVFGGSLVEQRSLLNYKAVSEAMYRLHLPTMAWTKIITKGSIPCRRFSHSLVAYNSRLYLFGGQSEKKMNDLWEYNIKTNVWSPVIAMGSFPSQRSGHVSGIVDDCLFIHGGADTLLCDGDVYLLPLYWKSHGVCALVEERLGRAGWEEVKLPPAVDGEDTEDIDEPSNKADGKQHDDVSSSSGQNVHTHRFVSPNSVVPGIKSIILAQLYRRLTKQEAKRAELANAKSSASFIYSASSDKIYSYLEPTTKFSVFSGDGSVPNLTSSPSLQTPSEDSAAFNTLTSTEKIESTHQRKPPTPPLSIPLSAFPSCTQTNDSLSSSSAPSSQQSVLSSLPPSLSSSPFNNSSRNSRESPPLQMGTALSFEKLTSSSVLSDGCDITHSFTLPAVPPSLLSAIHSSVPDTMLPVELYPSQHPAATSSNLYSTQTYRKPSSQIPLSFPEFSSFQPFSVNFSQKMGSPSHTWQADEAEHLKAKKHPSKTGSSQIQGEDNSTGKVSCSVFDEAKAHTTVTAGDPIAIGRKGSQPSYATEDGTSVSTQDEYIIASVDETSEKSEVIPLAHLPNEKSVKKPAECDSDGSSDNTNTQSEEKNVSEEEKGNGFSSADSFLSVNESQTAVPVLNRSLQTATTKSTLATPPTLSFELVEMRSENADGNCNNDTFSPGAPSDLLSCASSETKKIPDALHSALSTPLHPSLTSDASLSSSAADFHTPLATSNPSLSAPSSALSPSRLSFSSSSSSSSPSVISSSGHIAFYNLSTPQQISSSLVESTPNQYSNCSECSTKLSESKDAEETSSSSSSSQSETESSPSSDSKSHTLSLSQRLLLKETLVPSSLASIGVSSLGVNLLSIMGDEETCDCVLNADGHRLLLCHSWLLTGRAEWLKPSLTHREDPTALAALRKEWLALKERDETLALWKLKRQKEADSLSVGSQKSSSPSHKNAAELNSAISPMKSPRSSQHASYPAASVGFTSPPQPVKTKEVKDLISRLKHLIRTREAAVKERTQPLGLSKEGTAALFGYLYTDWLIPPIFVWRLETERTLLKSVLRWNKLREMKKEKEIGEENSTFSTAAEGNEVEAKMEGNEDFEEEEEIWEVELAKMEALIEEETNCEEIQSIKSKQMSACEDDERDEKDCSETLTLKNASPPNSNNPIAIIELHAKAVQFNDARLKMLCNKLLMEEINQDNLNEAIQKLKELNQTRLLQMYVGWSENAKKIGIIK
ncbi:putative rab9 effector protein [Monocercomonoides exilis]|uniref:putative rab9 effector protein n=1 Tax=Monocercomonoides exilis TaxID=2049356 RepID=UPI0035593DFC|nr:putative rab9 effector protein [Monocercomonoides exilis]|eukprot:MONOS_14246.1-p1 / transcript=MONOS_14246.1 / gene=MONOS_14246 / organism=Monocercomonoides_exilis_PA203 / gene_product=kelch repeat protein, putative / transcript_product=kelch repeat protein, putative / location=Mono_scaffold00962:7637-12112(-) / protein_length=1400 / sequence_SO=supercontig / SO=protein_coding / is_pseudo=false